MILKKWEDIPENLKNDETIVYYKILKSKKNSLAVKRLFDILVSLILLIILLPLLLILSIIIKIDSKGPVFYRQERVTQYGKIFKIFKFRTMIVDADKRGSLVTLNNDSRITKVGKKIRKLRLDEIPQLINILFGDMSFVGTRPEVKKYVDKYTDEMKATLLMPAGVTSLASIEYKDEDSIIEIYRNEEKNIDDIYTEKILPQKMIYNLEYIKKFNLWMDIRINIKTVLSILIKKKQNAQRPSALEDEKIEIMK